MFPNTLMPAEGLSGLKPGSKKRCTADVMPLICVIVPMPMMPAVAPKNANITASHFHFRPRPRSM